MKKQFTTKVRHLGLKLTAVVFALLLLASGQSWGQFNIDAGSVDYNQDFNSLTTGTWSNNTTITGWYAKTSATASITTYAANTGSTTTAGLYAFGIAGTNPLTDRALGYAPSNSYTGAAGTGKGFLGWRLKNNTGATITSLTITWTGEQWRKENNASSHTLNLTYQTGTTITDLNSGSWTTTTSNFTSPIVGATTATAIDGNASANRTTAITYNISTNIAAGDEIMLRWEDLNDSGNDHFLAIDDIKVNATVSGTVAPTVTSSAATFIGTTTATLNGDVTSDGGATITERGFCYKTSSGVTISDNKTTVSGTTGSFTLTPTLSPGQQYYFKAYAINSAGTTLSSPELSFYTLSSEPSAHASSFTATANSQNSITTTWSDNDGNQTASGFLVMANTTGTFTDPVDGAIQTNDASLSDNVAVVNVAHGTQTYTWSTGLNAGTTYYFKIYPYNGTGTSINYKTDPTVPTANTTTFAPLDVTSEVSGPALGSQPNPTLISSLVTTDGAAVRVFDMDIYDYATSDAQPTRITQLTIKAGTNNTANWANTIQGVKLSTDGGSTFATIGTPTITASAIVIPITSGNLNIPNNDALTVSLYVYLKSSGLTDNQILEFKVDATAASHGFTADATGSTFLATFASAPVSNQILIDVEATKLAFVQQPTNVGTSVNITPAVSVSANDVNNNRDLDYVTNVSISATGLTGSPVSATPVSGLATFSALSFASAATGVTLNATSGSLTGATSSSFDVINLPSAVVTLRPTHIDLASTTSESAVLMTLSYYSSNLVKFRLYNGSNQYYPWNESTDTYISSTTYSDGPLVIGTPSSSTTYWILFQRGSNNSATASYRDRLDPYSANYQTVALPSATSISSPFNLSGNFVGSGSYDRTVKHVVLAYNGSTLVSAASTALTTGAFTIVCPGGTTISKIEIRAVDNTLIESKTGNWSSTTATGNIPDNSVFTGTGNWSTAGNWNHGIPNSSTDVTISGDITITSTAQCNNLTIANGGKLTINDGSTLTPTGTFTIEDGGTLIDYTATQSSLTGKMKRNVVNADWNATDKSGYHLIASPNTNQEISGNWISGNYDFYAYDEITNMWLNQKVGANSLTHFTPGRGYLVAYDTDINKEFDGVFKNVNVTINLTKTASKGEGWNLLGNPYPSNLTWNTIEWTLTNVEGVAKVWKESSKAYIDVNPGDVIPANQGFWVKANAAVTGFVIPAAARTHTIQAYNKTSQTEKLSLSVTTTANTTQAVTNIIINDLATYGYDMQLEGTNLYGGTVSPNLYSVLSDGHKLSTNAIPTPTNSTVVNLGFNAYVNGNYTITANNSIANCTAITLEDLKTNTTQNLLQNPVYNFTAATNDNANRFVLHFATAVGVNEIGNSNGSIYAYDNNIYINAGEQIKQINVYNTLGQLVKTLNNVNGLQKINMNGNATGYYIVKVVSDKNVYSEKVFVK